MSETSTSVDSNWAMIEGNLTRIDTITFRIEATTVIYSSVSVSTYAKKN